MLFDTAWGQHDWAQLLCPVTAAETTRATTTVCKGSLDRDIKIEELQGSLAVDGFSSTISGCFGCLPLTSFSQNVGLVTMTGVINRFTILMGALILILASLFPPLGAFFNSLPQAVGDIFNGNAVAGVFVVSLLLSLILPKDKSEKVEE